MTYAQRVQESQELKSTVEMIQHLFAVYCEQNGLPRTHCISNERGLTLRITKLPFPLCQYAIK